MRGNPFSIILNIVPLQQIFYKMSKERHTGNREEGHKRENEKKPAAGQRKRFIRNKDTDTAKSADKNRRDKPARAYDNRQEARSERDKPKRPYGTRQEAHQDRDKPKRNYNSRQDARPDSDKPKRTYNSRPDSRPQTDSSKRYVKPEREERPTRSKGGRPDQFFARPDKKQDRPEKYTDERPERHSRDNDRTKRSYDKHKAGSEKTAHREKMVKEENEPGGAMPLNKYVAHCGICSRREAVDLIKEGKVKVNGEVMLQPGYKVEPTDKIEYGDKVISSQKNLVYILLNKPKNYITTTEDPQERKTVMELIADAGGERVYPVGRLDRNTTGLLLLTNDGELAQKLSHPKYNIKKLYQVTLDKPLTKLHFDKIMDGLTLEDGEVKVDAIAYLEKKTDIGIEIHSGRNRIVRRIFEHLGYTVEKLDRVMYAGLTKKNIPRGKWRFLNEQEVINLKYFKQ